MGKYIICFIGNRFGVREIVDEKGFSSIVEISSSTKFPCFDRSVEYTARVQKDGHVEDEPVNELATKVLNEIGLLPEYEMPCGYSLINNAMITSVETRPRPKDFIVKRTVRGRVVIAGKNEACLTMEQMAHIKTLCKKYGGKEVILITSKIESRHN